MIFDIENKILRAMFDYFVPPNLKFHNQYCPNYQVFPQHPTQQAPQEQDPIEDENDTDIEYVSTGYHVLR